jgi:hypothetical protein
MSTNKPEVPLDTEKVFTRGFLAGVATAVVFGLIALSLSNRRGF